MTGIDPCPAAALDLLARLTALPDEERERGIAATVARTEAVFGSTANCEDLRYLLAQLAAARAERDALRREVEGMRAAAEAVVAAWTAAPERSMPGDTDIAIARLQSVLQKRAATAALGGSNGR